MATRRTSFVWVCLILVLGGAGLLLAVNQNWFQGNDDPTLLEQREAEREKERLAELEAKQLTDKQAASKALGTPEEELVLVGGVWRHKRDVAFGEKAEGQAKAPSVDEVRGRRKAGVAGALKGDENAQVAGLMAELQGQDEAARARVTSTRVKPEPFNREQFLSDPDTYVQRIRPARVYDPAQPGPDVTPLEALTTPFQSILQGEQINFRVKADPGMPVAFYTPQVGTFDNLLSSITVVADEEGIATAAYRAGPGSQGLTDVLAASPVHSGQLQFRVIVELPESQAGQ